MAVLDTAIHALAGGAKRLEVVGRKSEAPSAAFGIKSREFFVFSRAGTSARLIASPFKELLLPGFANKAAAVRLCKDDQ
jgi:hypothetical protein